uniref:Golgi to ER traffic protein 4 homolog (Trinotate prediction) n=1 Tax=Myxobolus squamalis TaxID=59785 RepID=A0A6B2G472_MYXSQ
MSDYFQKTTDSIDVSISEREFYKALQLIKTLAFRYVNAKMYQKALALLMQKILKFIEFKEIESAVELTKVYLDICENVLNNSKEEIFNSLITLIKHITISYQQWQSVPNRILALAKKTKDDAIVAKIDHAFSSSFIDAGLCYQARSHSIKLQDSSFLTDFLLKYSKRFIYKEEIDLFILQFVLSLLARNKFVLATCVFNNFVRSNEYFKHNYDFPYSFPALNFIYFLFRSIGSKSYDQFAVLVEIYRPTLRIDPSNEGQIDVINKIYFPNRQATNENLPPNSTSTNPGGLVGLMNSILPMFGGLLNQIPPAVQTNTSTSHTQSSSNENIDDFMDVD